MILSTLHKLTHVNLHNSKKVSVPVSILWMRNWGTNLPGPRRVYTATRWEGQDLNLARPSHASACALRCKVMLSLKKNEGGQEKPQKSTHVPTATSALWTPRIMCLNPQLGGREPRGKFTIQLTSDSQSKLVLYLSLLIRQSQINNLFSR